MIPPEALLKDGTRLSLDEFGAEFAVAWSRLGKRFLKVECWQEYQEIEAAESQKAYDSGDISTALDLLRNEAESDRPLYQDVKRRSIEYARIRLVHVPLTAYLQYEMMAYAIRAQIGENIRIAKFPSTFPLPGEKYFDFLLFDQHTALIHDYGQGPVGVQSGGWLVRDSETIEFLEKTALAILGNSVPVEKFLAAESG